MKKSVAKLIAKIDFIREALDGETAPEETKKVIMAVGREAFKKATSREEDDLICDSLVFLLTNEEINELSK